MKMKKLLAVTSATVLTLSSLGISSAMLPVQAETEVLMSDTFEEGYGAWKGVGSTVTLTSDYAHEGNQSLYCYDRTASWGAPRCALTGIVAAGNSYTISCATMYEGEGTQSCALKMIYTDSSGTDHYDSVVYSTATAGEWCELSGTYNVPTGATGMILYVEYSGISTDQGYYIDDVTISGEKVDIQLDDSFTSDFEDGTQNWNGRGSATAEVSTNYAHGGTQSLYVSGRTQLWNGATRSTSDIMEAGGYYKIGAYFLYDDTTYSDTQKFSINLQYDLNGKECYYTIATETLNAKEWKYVGSEFTVPTGATNFYVYVQTGYTSAPSDKDMIDFYLDDAIGEHLPDPAIQDDITSLKDAYADYFKMGCAVASAEFTQNATKDLILKHYDCITIGNELKPDSVLDQTLSQKYYEETGDDTAPQISLNEADEMLKWAAENNVQVRGHVLVWHSQTPDWFFKEGFSSDGDWVSKEKMTQRLENYIKIVMETMATEYPDVDFYAWDVVNEAASDSGTIREAGSNNDVSGQSAWVKVFGDQSYIKLAFQYARKYAPEGCKLFYNDYNEYSPNKQSYIISDILTPLIEDNLIDGMGLQSHISMSYPSIDLYKSAIQKYADLGLELQVTELDVSQKSNATADQLELAQRYQDVFKMYKSCVDDGINLSRVTIWGITDSTSWIGGYPLLFDKDYQAKDAFYAVVDTDSEVATLGTATAYYFDGTDTDKEQALTIQNSTTVGSTSLKFVYDDSNLYIIGDTNDFEAAFTGETAVSAKDNMITLSLTDKTSPLELTITSSDGTWGTTGAGIVTLKKQPAYAETTQGTITVDGTIDEAWADANTLNINTFSMGSTGATGTAKVLWDENYLYVLAEVTDAKLSNASANAYEQDTVEVFFDENNHKSASYETDDAQCRVSYTGDKTVTDGLSTDRFESAAAVTNNGYLIEFAIPYTISNFTADEIIGFDVQINDDGTGEGSRTAIANWNDLTGMGYTDTSGYGVLKLVGDASSVATTVTTKATTTTTTQTTTTATANSSSATTENILYGDVNLDNNVDMTDLIVMNKIVANLVQPTTQQSANADVNADGAMDATDGKILLQFNVHILSTLPYVAE